MRRCYSTLFFAVAMLTFGLFSCTRDQEVINNSGRSLDQTKDGEMHWNTDARMATINALQYVHANINPELIIQPNSEQLPIFISGKEALEFINLDGSPYSEDEQEFIKEQLYKPQSRAVLMRNVIHKDGKQIGNVVYVPYEEGLKVKDIYVNQLGAFLDTFEWECRLVHSTVGQIGGQDCHCFHMMSCDFAEFCWTCPENWGDYSSILERLQVNPKIILDVEEAFKERFPIGKMPLHESMLNPRLM